MARTPRKPRRRELTDRQLHAALEEAFSDWMTANDYPSAAKACKDLERVLDEFLRRHPSRGESCTCEVCHEVRELVGES